MGQLDNRPDGVDTYPADQHDLDSYMQAERALTRMQTPILLHADNPHERLYFAALDGTGNSMFDDAPGNWSVVAKFYEQISALKDQGITNIYSGYVEGTFTQDNPITRYVDGIAGFTFERRVETAYYQFCEQAKNWLEEDPHAQIRVVGIGFSRGAEEVAALHRMIDERGILDPEGATIARDKEGLIVQIEYTDRALVPPGHTLQAAVLFDPVATGVKEHDRRLPSSMMSVLQITAEDERRDQFESTDMVPPGFSENNRFYNAIVGGCHSDIGNTYWLNGLGARNFNLGVVYLNALSDRPFLVKQAVPDDPALSVVHRSDQHSWVYTERGYRDGIRDHHNDLGGVQCGREFAEDCTRKEPIDPELDKLLERRGVPIGPVPAMPGQRKAPSLEDDTPEAQALRPSGAKSETDQLFDRLYQATLSNDSREIHAVGRDYLRSPDGQTWQQDVREYGQAEEARERQVAWAAQQQREAEQVQQAHRPHAMRM